MDTVLAAVPFWMWLLAAAMLGAATVWIYWRCLLADRLSIVETELTARDMALADAQAELQALGSGAHVPIEEVGRPIAAAHDEFETVAQDFAPEGIDQPAIPKAAVAADPADAGEIETLRYRAWALETRLRTAIDHARSGAPVDVAGLSRDLEELTDDGAPLEEISALKYRNWLFENRLARMAERAPVEADDAAGASGPVAAAPTEQQPMVDRLRDRMSRMMTAAKLGNLSDISEIEQEMASDPEGLAPLRISFDAQPPLGMDLTGDGSATALRYRNWLLGVTLKRVCDRLRTDQTIDPDDLETMLRAESRGRVLAEPEVVETDDGLDLNSTEMRLDAVRRERDRFADEASGLRYRRWLLSRRLGDVVYGLRDGSTVDPDMLEDALRREGETALDNTDAPRPAFLGARVAFADRLAAQSSAPSRQIEGEVGPEARDDLEAREEAESLRYRLWLVQGELRRLRTRETSAATEAAQIKHVAAPAAGVATIAGDANVAAGHARLWSAEWRAQMMRGRAEAIEMRMVERDRAAGDIATSLRTRLAQAEAALRTLRGARPAMAAAPAVVSAANVDPAELARIAAEKARLADLEQAAQVALAESREEAAVLRRRLWDVEWTQKDHDETTTRLRDEAAQARSRLIEADQRRADLERRVEEAETELDLAREEARTATDRASVAVIPADDPDPMLVAELETLRTRLRSLERAEGDVAALRRVRDETETLRSRLALSEAENERIRVQLSDAARSLTGGSALSRASEAVRETAPERGDRFYESRREPIFERTVIRSEPAPSAPSARLSAMDYQGHDVFAEHLAPAFSSPLGGAEAAADELIERREVTARESNRPSGFLSAPQGGADDLSLIRGVDPRRAADLARLGVFHFYQIAEMGPRDLAWLDDRLGLRGGILRDRWQPQARMLSEWGAAGRLQRDRNGRFYLRPESRREGFERNSEDRRYAEVQSADRDDLGQLRRAVEDEAARGWREHSDAIDAGGPVWGVEMAARDLLDEDPDAPASAQAPRLPAAPTGAPDDLTALRGVGPSAAEALNQLGVSRFEQLADLSPEAAAWIDRRLGLRGRLVRDRWIPQAYGQVERRERAARAARLAAAKGETGSGSGTPRPRDGRAERQNSDWVRRERAPGAYPDEDLVDRDPEEIEEEARRLVSAGDRGRRPDWLDERSAGGERDDLTRIEGLGPKMEARLNELGIARFDQMARLSARDLAWLESELGLGGRSLREGWLSQARELAGGRWRRRGARRDRDWSREREPRQEREPRSEREPRKEREPRAERQSAPEPAAKSEGGAQAAAVDSEMTEDEVEALKLLEEGYEPDLTVRPDVLLEAPTRGDKDDLKEIWGIGVKFEELLNDLGVYYFDQLAALKAQDLAWVDARLRFKGRAVRDRWIPQARAIVAQRQSEGD